MFPGLRGDPQNPQSQLPPESEQVLPQPEQGLPVSQPPAEQTPAVHTSPVVQTFPSQTEGPSGLN